MENYKDNIKILVDILNQENNIKIDEELMLEAPKKDIIYLYKIAKGKN